MTKLTLAVPVVGEKVTVAEPKVDTALKAIEEFLNGAKIESTDNIKPGGITEASLATALQEKFTNRKGMAVEKPAGSTTGESEKLYQLKNGATLELPAATLNAVVGAFALEASAKVKTAAGVIKGDFFSGATATLTQNQHLLLVADGTNWMIESGEPKREQEYVPKVFTKAEAEAGVEPSATRAAYVEMVAETEKNSKVLTIGGKNAGYVPGQTEPNGTSLFYVPPGQKWKTTIAVLTYTVLL